MAHIALRTVLHGAAGSIDLKHVCWGGRRRSVQRKGGSCEVRNQMSIVYSRVYWSHRISSISQVGVCVRETFVWMNASQIHASRESRLVRRKEHPRAYQLT